MVAASWSKRALAYAIDLHINMLVLLCAYLVSLEVSKRTSPEAALWSAVGLYVLWYGIGCYNRCYVMGRTGQSWGRSVLGISLVEERTGQPPGMLKATGREFSHFFDVALLGAGYMLPMWDRKRQTIADKIMKTVTVEGNPASAPAPVHLVPAGASPTEC